MDGSEDSEITEDHGFHTESSSEKRKLNNLMKQTPVKKQSV